MNVKSHLIIASASYIGLMTIKPHYDPLLSANFTLGMPLYPVAGFLLCLISSLLPDLDHPKSTLGSKLTFISYPTSAIFGHRGITHSFLMIAALVFFIKDIATSSNVHLSITQYFILPFVVGYLSHLLADLCTPAGLPLLYPAKKRFNIAYISSPGIQFLLSAFLLVGSLWFYMKNGF